MVQSSRRASENVESCHFGNTLFSCGHPDGISYANVGQTTIASRTRSDRIQLLDRARAINRPLGHLARIGPDLTGANPHDQRTSAAAVAPSVNRQTGPTRCLSDIFVPEGQL